jgi:hypothetical protein
MGISPTFSPYATHPAQLGIATGWQHPLLQNPLITAGVQNPLIYPGLQNPILQNPVLQHQLLQHQLLQNPILHGPFVNPIQAQLQQAAEQLALQAYLAHAGGGSPYVTGSPYGQTGSPFLQGGLQSTPGIPPLAPQTWVGPGAGIGYGQGHPLHQHVLAQLAGRGFQTPGISPWGGF